MYIIFKFPNALFMLGTGIVRNNIRESVNIRWEVMKSMLDDFPQLRDRTREYLMGNANAVEMSSTGCAGSGVKEMVNKAVKEYRRGRSRK